MIDVDLLAHVPRQPADARRRARRRVRAYSAWLVAAATVAALLAVYLRLGRVEQQLDSTLARARITASQVRRAAKPLRSLEEQSRRLRAAQKALRALRGRARLDSTPALGALERTMPRDVWLERLHIRRGEVTIEGYGPALSPIMALAKELSISAVFSGAMELVDVRHTQSSADQASGSPRAGGDSLFHFTLRGTLRARPASTRK